MMMTTFTITIKDVTITFTITITITIGLFLGDLDDDNSHDDSFNMIPITFTI